MTRRRPVAEYSAALALVVLAWWYASGSMGMPLYLLPSPQSTVAALARLAADGTLWGYFAYGTDEGAGPTQLRMVPGA